MVIVHHETNSSHLKIDGWKMKFPLGMAEIIQMPADASVLLNYVIVILFLVKL